MTVACLGCDTFYIRCIDAENKGASSYRGQEEVPCECGGDGHGSSVVLRAKPDRPPYTNKTSLMIPAPKGQNLPQKRSKLSTGDDKLGQQHPTFFPEVPRTIEALQHVLGCPTFRNTSDSQDHATLIFSFGGIWEAT